MTIRHDYDKDDACVFKAVHVFGAIKKQERSFSNVTGKKNWSCSLPRKLMNIVAEEDNKEDSTVLSPARTSLVSLEFSQASAVLGEPDWSCHV